MLFSPRLGRVTLTTVGLLVLLCFAFVLRNNSVYRGPSWPFQFLSSNTNDQYIKFGNSLFEALDQTPPGIPTLHRTGDASATVFWRADANTSRPDMVTMTPESITTMRTAHDLYLEKIQHIQVPFNAGQQGIVSTSSGASLPIFIVSLRMLRRTGCTLPVELFLGTESDYDPYMCETILPSLNAYCTILSSYTGTSAAETLASFQFKIFSILFSEFEDILFLDADNLVVTNPEPYFTNPPFTTTGLVTWQDFWASSTSAHFYSIQSLSSTPPMTSRASTESGQLLVSKRKHASTLLMAAYYNFYGPGYYYELLSQGGPGAGDKETFMAGAEAVRAPFHQVSKPVDTVGYYDEGQYHGVAMLQYGPTNDADSEEANVEAQPKPVPFAMHHNYPKPDPLILFAPEDPQGHGNGAAVSSATGLNHRLWGSKELTQERFGGRDVERDMWDEIYYVACTVGVKFRHWRVIEEGEAEAGTCGLVERYRKTVFVHEEDM